MHSRRPARREQRHTPNLRDADRRVRASFERAAKKDRATNSKTADREKQSVTRTGPVSSSIKMASVSHARCSLSHADATTHFAPQASPRCTERPHAHAPPRPQPTLNRRPLHDGSLVRRRASFFASFRRSLVVACAKGERGVVGSRRGDEAARRGRGAGRPCSQRGVGRIKGGRRVHAAFCLAASG